MNISNIIVDECSTLSLCSLISYVVYVIIRNTWIFISRFHSCHYSTFSMWSCTGFWLVKSCTYISAYIKVIIYLKISTSDIIYCGSCTIRFCNIFWKPFNYTSRSIYRFHCSTGSIAVLNLLYSSCNLFCPV